MKKYAFLLLILFLGGCTTVSYYPVAWGKLKPKPQNYEMPFYEGAPDLGRPYRVIGTFEVRGDTAIYASWKNVFDKAKAVASGKGADAVVNTESSYQTYNSAIFIPGSTRYQPVTTYHQGTTSLSAQGQYYGSGGYYGSSTAYGTGTYSGTSTTFVPVYTPPSTIPYQAAVLRYRGTLIVFTDKAEQDMPPEFKDKFSKLTTNMTITQVKELLGKPYREHNWRTIYTTLLYCAPSCENFQSVPVVFKNSLFIGWGRGFLDKIRKEE